MTSCIHFRAQDSLPDSRASLYPCFHHLCISLAPLQQILLLHASHSFFSYSTGIALYPYVIYIPLLPSFFFLDSNLLLILVTKFYSSLKSIVQLMICTATSFFLHMTKIMPTWLHLKSHYDFVDFRCAYNKLSSWVCLWSQI